VINTVFRASGYKLEDLIKLNIDISDDFKLDSVEYKYNNESLWKTIDTDYISKTSDYRWTISSELWETLPENIENIDYIMFKISDHADNNLITSEEKSLHIIQAEEPVEITLDLTDFSKFQWDDKFSITTNPPDELDVDNTVLLFRYAEDEDDLKNSKWKQYGENRTQAPYEWNFKAKDGNGFYEFKIKITDSEGNIYESPVEVVEVEVYSMIPIIVILVIIMLLICLTGYIYHRKKKQRTEETHLQPPQ